MATCNPEQLLAAGRCFAALTFEQRDIAMTQILCNLSDHLLNGGPMPTCDPQTLLNDGKCFACLTADQRKTIQTQLLCEIADALGGPSGGGAFIPRVGADVASASVPYSASMAIDFDGPGLQRIAATGNLTLSTANRTNAGDEAKFVTLRIAASPGPITISLAPGIKSVTTFPAILGVNKIGYLTLVSTGPNESDTDAAFKGGN